MSGIRNILASKEHLVNITDVSPDKLPLANILKKHDAVFTDLNDVATVIRFSINRGDIERAIGSELLGNVAGQATRTLLSDLMSTDVLRNESIKIKHIQNDREGAFKLKVSPSILKEEWPIDIMPINIVSCLANKEFKEHEPASCLNSIAKLIILLNMEDEFKSFLKAGTGNKNSDDDI